MTDFDKVQALFKELDIPFKNPVLSPFEFKKYGMKAIVVENDGSTNKVDGYGGFGFYFYFNEDGVFNKVCIWE